MRVLVLSHMYPSTANEVGRLVELGAYLRT